MKKSRRDWPLKWGLAFAAVPIGYALFLINAIVENSRPLGPNEAECGMPRLMVVFLLVFVTPMSWLVGAACGWVAARIARSMLFDQGEEGVREGGAGLGDL